MPNVSEGYNNVAGISAILMLDVGVVIIIKGGCIDILVSYCFNLSSPKVNLLQEISIYQNNFNGDVDLS